MVMLIVSWIRAVRATPVPVPADCTGGTRTDACDSICRNDYDRHVFRMQKNAQGSRGTWDNVKKAAVMPVSVNGAVGP